MKLLCISNGHGEDVIACRILNAVRQSHPTLELSALPITGSGSTYLSSDIPIIGQTKVLPSGGFLNRDPKQLARDVQKGLIPLTRSQLAAIKAWAATADKSGNAILAVGDIVPQIFAHLSGLPYVFVGTAKSEYWLRDDAGQRSGQRSGHRSGKTLGDRLEGWSGSVYLPWERWLMARNNCRAVFVRDALTAKTLKGLGIRAYYEGNPMMDSLAPEGKLDGLLAHIASTSEPVNSGQHQAEGSLQDRETLTIALLPGSRQPEAYENWANIMNALPSLVDTFPAKSIILLGAIAPSLSPDKLPANPNTWTHQSTPYSTFTHQNVTLLLIQDAYNDCLQAADIAIATAGTATEQFVGLGKPAITLPGNGPQFTQAFATVQAKMLGPSVHMVCSPKEIGGAIAQILSDRDRLQLIQENGKQRMGEPGGGERIARQLIKHLTTA
ncbi:MAG: lipid-A-disaccharide synthase-related protein, partial [Cyanobacteria bacterium J06597_16]